MDTNSESGLGPDQTYCLRWNNHKTNLVEILDALIKMESYVDCTIYVDDQAQFKAHRVVLAANSTYFQSILQDVPMDHCSILFPGVKPFEMRVLLEYMYTGEVNVTESQIPRIMKIAQQLEVKGLFDMTDLREIKDEHHNINQNFIYNNQSALRERERDRDRDRHERHRSITPPNIKTSSSSLNHLNHHHHNNHLNHHLNNQQSIISTSTNITSAQSSSSSPPQYHSYKSPYSSIYSNRSPQPQTSTSATTTTTNHNNNGHTGSTIGIQPSSSSSASSTAAVVAHHLQNHQQLNDKWQQQQHHNLHTAAAAMLSSVYETGSDMNPLKRKKLSSISSMLMSTTGNGSGSSGNGGNTSSHHDTPILRNVLAQTNIADSSQQIPVPLICNKERNSDRHSTHSNGTDYSDKVSFN